MNILQQVRINDIIFSYQVDTKGETKLQTIDVKTHFDPTMIHVPLLLFPIHEYFDFILQSAILYPNNAVDVESTREKLDQYKFKVDISSESVKKVLSEYNNSEYNVLLNNCQL